MKQFISLFIIGMIMTLRMTAQNPLLEKFNTPYEVPPFDKIKPEHYLPALKVAMENHNQEISAIVNNKEKANFLNTIEALETSGELLNSINTIFQNVNGANTNPDLQKIAKEVAPMLSKHYDNINLNKDLFKRINTVYQGKENLKLDNEQSRLLENTYKSFVRSGAALDADKQKKLKEINEKLSVLTLKFGDNMLSETNSFKLVIDNEADLAGLPASLIASAADDAKAAGKVGKWIFSLQAPSIFPFLQYSSKRELREKILYAYANRCNNKNEYDNNQIVKDITNLRLERANLLGYKTHADYAVERNMAQNPKTIFDLLNKLWEPSLLAAKREAKVLQNMIEKDGNNFKLAPADWRFYSEKVRKEQYDLDEEQVRSYLKLDNVKDGVFLLTNKLYGLTFKENTSLPKYHPDATAYEVYDNDNSLLAILYMDFHPRASKRGGAWMTNYREECYKNGKRVIPVISLVCNFSKPSGDTPALLTFDEAETLFHEFGHGLHGMFANGRYVSTSGTNVPRDFVELPSQIMEHWVSEKEFLKLFAKNYKTGEVIPDELIQKLENSSKFNQGFVTTEFLAAAYLDLFYYNLSTPLNIDVQEFETKELTKLGLIPEIIVRYRSTYFRHVFAGGYDAGYYSYIWSGVLDSDAFEAFKVNGIFDKATATSFRKNILEKGYTEEPMTLYKKFRGAEPSIEPLLKNRGLKPIQ